ncbi:MAG TPA: lytic transglycosylase domain-containing protein [Nitrospiraceae bacterium]|nr:lytic transglycosylase domain-containing protein [Nitrospiraceae bacterium]
MVHAAFTFLLLAFVLEATFAPAQPPPDSAVQPSTAQQAPAAQPASHPAPDAAPAPLPAVEPAPAPISLPATAQPPADEPDKVEGTDVPDVPEPDDQLIILPEIKRDGPRHFLSSFKLPDKLTFGGQTIPLDSWQVRERIEYEFYQFLEDEGESIILAKRTGRCFPPAEKQLADAGLPDDLKFMLLVESKCIAAAYSRAKASGPWQFIGATGKRYKLKSDQWKDDRRNLEMSTEAAVKYLRYLKDLFDGDWFLAMAAYNAGEERIRKQLKSQKVDDYWRLHLVRETMRYVPRIIAAKEIYSQPEKYLGLTKQDMYAPLDTETVTVTIKEPQKHLASLAKELGSYFLELKLLNPEIKKEYLPKGTHQLKVPKQDCPLKCFKQDKTP